MGLSLRITLVAAVLGQLACSSPDADRQAPGNGMIPVFSGPPVAQPGTSGAMPDAPPSGTEPPANTAPPAVTPTPAPEEPPTPTLPPSTETEGTGNDGSSGPPPTEPPPGNEAPSAEAPPDPPEQTPEDPPVEPPPAPVSTRRSSLPLPPGPGGEPPPSGQPGNLRVLNWAGFRGAVSYTFDDTNASQIQNYDALQALDVPFTFYLQTNKTTELNNPVWRRAVQDGHEIGNHTQSHLSAGPNLAADTDAATRTLESLLGVKVYTMAAPTGSTEYVPVARTRFLINRGVSGQQIAANNDSSAFNLPCFIPATNASAAAMNAPVDNARNGGTWATVLLHGFTNSAQDGAFQPVALSEFVASVQHAKDFGDLWLDTVVAVGAYWRGQVAFNAVTPVTNGSTTTWTWTLPANFPPEQFLRVRVDGGTLSQAGETLPWNDRGFYEVALDVGSLTLSP